MDLSERLDQDAQGLYVQLNKAMALIVNGRKHIPSILRYRNILNHLDDHPEDYGEYFFHKN